MKALSILAIALLSSGAQASPFCKEFDKAAGQGYEVIFNGTTASLYNLGNYIGDLKRTGTPVVQGDLKTIVYRQNVVNGYEVVLESGGIVGLTKAIISHAGVAGFTPVAELYDCK